MKNHYIGLYYPHSEFKNESWLKLAVLYWDRLGRIVPQDYVLRDSNTVKQLKAELDFIKDFEPSEEDMHVVGNMFLQLSQLSLERQQKLIRLYNVRNTPGKVNPKQYALLSQRRIGKSSLFFLEANDLIKRVDEEAIRVLDIPGNPSLFRLVHPRFAFVYMEALATRMATARQLYPVTDNVSDHIAISEYTMERLIQELLDLDTPQPHHKKVATAGDEFELRMANIALQSVLPQNLENVSVKKIIRFRQRHENELTAFQHYLHQFIIDLESLQIDDLDALKTHLEVEYEKVLKPQVEDLKKSLKSLGIGTVAGVMNMRVALPPLLTSVGEYLLQAHISLPNPIIVGGGAIAFNTFSVLQKKQEEARKLIQTTPTAYLLYAHEELNPASMISQISQTTRKMIFRA